MLILVLQQLAAPYIGHVPRDFRDPIEMPERGDEPVVRGRQLGEVIDVAHLGRHSPRREAGTFGPVGTAPGGRRGGEDPSVPPRQDTR